MVTPGRPHHFVHLSELAASALPVGRGLLGQADHGSLHAATGVLRQGSEEDMAPHRQVLHLGWRETCHQLHLEESASSVSQDQFLTIQWAKSRNVFL